MKNIINQESSKFWILQLLAALSAGVTSFLSLDSKSQKEYLSLYLLLLSIKMESQKAYHFCQGEYSPIKKNYLNWILNVPGKTAYWPRYLNTP